MLEHSGGGIAIAPGDAARWPARSCELLDSPERRAAMGKAGRRYVEQHHSRAVIAARLEELLTRSTARARNGAA